MGTSGIQMGISLDVTPARPLERLGGRAVAAVRRALYRAGSIVQREAMKNAPVLTGNLRRSINTFPGDDDNTVFVGVPDNIDKRVDEARGPAAKYAARAERRHPHLAPAWEAKRGEAESEFRKAIDAAIEGLARP